MEEKLQELAKKYDIPEQLLRDAIQKEREKVVLVNRKMVPTLIQAIERYADLAKTSITDTNHDT